MYFLDLVLPEPQPVANLLLELLPLDAGVDALELLVVLLVQLGPDLVEPDVGELLRLGLLLLLPLARDVLVVVVQVLHFEVLD